MRVFILPAVFISVFLYFVVVSRKKISKKKEELVRKFVWLSPSSLFFVFRLEWRGGGWRRWAQNAGVHPLCGFYLRFSIVFSGVQEKEI